MRKHLLISLLLLIAALGFQKNTKACHAIALINFTQQNITGSQIQVTAASNSPTCGCSTYWLDVEVRCLNEAFDAAPFNPGFWGPLATYPYFQSAQMNKPSCVVQNYPWVTIPFARLCPGMTYQYRMRENHNGAVGPWTGAQTFVVPGNSSPLNVAASASLGTICAGDCVTLDATIVVGCGLAATSAWNNGAGTGAQVTVCPVATTTYSVTVTEICSGNTDVASVTVNVVPPPVVGTVTLNTPATICIGDPAALTLVGSAGTIQWQSAPNAGGPWTNMGGQTGATLNIGALNASTCYRAQVTGCGPPPSGQTILTTNVVCITVDPAPIANFNFTPVCSGAPMNFTDATNLNGGSAITAWAWDFGDGGTSTAQNPSHTYGGFGPYNVTLTVTNGTGCSNTVVIPVSINPDPTANFNAIPGCPGAATTFTDASVVGGGATITGWAWDFGDGNTSTAQNPSHTYAAPGTYNVTLTVTSNAGCTNTIIIPVTISGFPVADFTTANVCDGNAATFTDNSIPPAGGTNVQWNWDFGDGNTGTGTPINHTYAGPGTYNVTLTVTSNAGCTHSVILPITIYQNATADFTFPNPWCLSDPITFTDASNGNGTTITNWAWDFGDGTTGTGQVPGAHTYATVGPHNVSLTVTTNAGCTGTVVYPVTLEPDPTPDFIFAPGCPGSPSGFTDASIPGGTSTITGWSWDFGDGNTSTAQNPTNTYVASGNYNVTLTVTSSTGCTNTSIIPVVVPSGPVVDFTPIGGCDGVAATFTDATIVPGGTAVQWDWDFGDGNTATGNPTSHTYATNGTYNVTLTVVTNAGCTGSLTLPIDIFPNPTSNFTFPSPWCAADPLAFTDVSNGNGGTIANWAWDFGDGNTSTLQNPTHNYGGALGPFNITLVVSTINGCTGTLTQPVTLEPAPTPDFTYVGACEGFATVFTDASVAGGGATIASWAWDFGDGNTSTAQNPSNIYTAPGTYMVQLNIVSSTGCMNTITLPVNVFYNPVAEINMANVCDGVTGNFNDASTVTGSTVVNWAWDMGDGTTHGTQNVIHSYGASTYNVSLTVTSAQGCVDDTIMSITIFPNPIANFSPTVVCEGYPTVLNDLTNPNGGTLDTWNWDIFDDGTVEYNTVSPTHSFAPAGTYDVELMVNTVNGCADSIVLQVVVDPAPVADFTHVIACPGFATAFTDATTIIGGATVTGWAWDFGDGNTSTAQNPSNVYTSPGIYNVELIATGSSGCVDTVLLTVDVPFTPVAEFSMADVCDGTPGTFTDLSTVTNAAIVQLDWDFGDGNTGVGSPITHGYAANGTYTVTLTATSDQGCFDDTSMVITINPNPIADFIPTAVCVGVATSLADISNGNGGTINNWAWDMLDDGSVEYSVQNGAHTFPAEGTYDVELWISTINGCMDSVVLPITVHPRPTADFTLTNICEGQLASFTDASVITTGTITGWEWDFGNGNTSALQNPTETYAVENVYTVELVAHSAQGCTDTMAQTIDVYPNPVADFTPQAVCLNVPVDFIDISTISNANTVNSITTWAWDLGDGTTSAVQNPLTHVYGTAGTYVVSLTVTSNHGCTDNLMVPLDIYEKPVADFTTTDDCANLAANFTDISTITGSTISNWQWDFGDGTTSNLQNPTHLYGADGVYNVELIVTSVFGCEDTVVLPATRHAMPVANFAALNECVYDSVCFNNMATVNAPSTILSTVWSFGDGTPISGANTPCHLYATEGTYDVMMIVTSNFGCPDDTLISVTVHPKPNVDFTSAAICINEPPTTFTNTSSIVTGSIIGWNWNFGDGTAPSPAQNPTHVYGAAGIYSASLIGISDFGCIDTATYPVTVFEKPTAMLSSDVVEGCDPLNVNFLDQSAHNANSMASWQWDFGNGLTSADENPSNILFVGSGTLADISYDVSLIVTNDNGCMDTVAITSCITVHPDPIADFIAEPSTTNEHDPIIQFMNQSSTSESYLWYFGDGDTSTVEHPSHYYTDTGSIDVMLIAYTQYGCVDTTYQSIVIEPVPGIYMPNAFTPDGDGVNDVFMPVLYAHDQSQYEFYIFDRWGQIIFESFTPSHGWDGNVNGGVDNSKSDVYVWKVVLRSSNSGEQKEYYGHVTLLK